jgi:hypothetical protein
MAGHNQSVPVCLIAERIHDPGDGGRLGNGGV